MPSLRSIVYPSHKCQEELIKMNEKVADAGKLLVEMIDPDRGIRRHEIKP